MSRGVPTLLLLAAAAAADPAPRPAGAAGADPPPLFVDATREAGLASFTHVNGGTSPIVIYETVPPGAALFDADGDLDLDLFLVQSGPRRFPPSRGSLPSSGRLLRNDGPGREGLPRFQDVTRTAGLESSGYGVGAAAADVDNDGDVDLYLTRYGPNRLFLNRGGGRFADVTEAAGVGDARMSTSAAFADVDGNGYVDLYVANYVDFAAGPEFCVYEGVKSGCSDREYPGLPNSLYLNQGPGAEGVPRFREAARERGVEDPTGRGLGAVFADLDGDGDQDLYVANDGGGNRLFVNDGRGFFRDDTLMSGTGYSEAGLGEASMGVDLGDADGDGRFDIFVTNFARETNSLYHNDGEGFFSHATVAAGLARPSYLPLGWGTLFFDADLDGDLDLFVANGHVYDVCSLINPQDSFGQPNQMFLNDGRGVFTEVTRETVPALARADASRGAAFGDVDDDGDVDIYVANNGGPGQLLINRAPRAGRHGLRLRLVGGPSNRQALGARVTVTAGGLRLAREVKSSGSYLSSSDPRLIIGIGGSGTAESVEVRWPSGAVQRFARVPAGAPLVLTEGEPSWKEDRIP